MNTRLLSQLSAPFSFERGDNAPPLPLINSEQLFGKSEILLIQHQGQHYQLRITKSGKLILTK